MPLQALGNADRERQRERSRERETETERETERERQRERERGIHASGCIRTRDFRKQAAEKNPQFRPHGHWERLQETSQIIFVNKISNKEWDKTAS